MMKWICLFPVAFAFALPQQPAVIAGNASFVSSPDVLEIAAADQTIIEWNTFNISESETTRFTELGSVFNRVLDAHPSRLMGRLESKGQVILVNPNGIVVGRDAQIDTGSFIASTLDRQLPELFKGDASSTLTIEGKIEAAGGAIALIGGQIHQKGFLRADAVYLLAGSEVEFGAAAKVLSPSAGIIQEGQIAAERISIQTLEGTLHHSGEILSGKEAILFAEKGMNWVDGSVAGPSIKVLGDRVGLGDTARLDASGTFGGGTVLVGGDFHGQAPPNAREVYVSPSAQILADAIERGEGGKVVLWGDQSNAFFGTVLARGGTLGGDGGMVEISSPGQLIPEGIVDTSSSLGKTGTLLLDPADVTISIAANSAGVVLPAPNNYIFNATPANISSNVLNAQRIQVFLAANNVVVDTANCAGAGCGGNGDITVTNGISWASNFSLTLRANRNINIFAPIQNTGAADVVLIAPTGGTITVGGAGGTIAVGSLNGRTFVGDPQVARCQRTRPNILVKGTNGGGGSMIGFSLTALNNNASGPIDVTCGALTLNASSTGAGFGSAQIGHGSQFAGLAAMTTAAATITVDALGDIHIQAGNQFSDAQIGHGGRELLGGGVINGNICVSSSGSIFLEQTIAGSFGVTSIIGSGVDSGSAVTPSNVNGDVTVQCQEDLVFTSNGGNPTACVVGHFTDGGNGLPTGNVYAIINRDLVMNSSSAGQMYIGHNKRTNALVTTCTSNCFISVGGNATVNAASSQGVQFGTSATTLTNGLLEMLVKGNLTVNSSGNSAVAHVAIGFISTSNLATADTNVAVGGNITLTPAAGTGQQILVTGRHDVNVAAQGNIDGTGTGSGVLQSAIASQDTAGGTTRIFAAGYIRSALNGANLFEFGKTGANTGASLFVKAGQDVIIRNGFTTSTGTIFLQAGKTFAAGDLWTAPACVLAPCGTACIPPLQLATICGAAAIAMPTSPCLTCALSSFCSAVTTFLPANSAAAAGAACTQVNFNNNIYATASGNFSLLAACNAGCVSPLTIGTQPANNIQIGSPIGTVGSFQVGGYSSITLNQSITTSGGFGAGNAAGLLSACGTVTIPATRNIVSNGPGASVMVISDSDLNGAGDISLAANITTANGPITLNAGFGGPAASTASISQTGGQISSGNGAILAEAGKDITVNGAATSFTSTAGSITLSANNSVFVQKIIASASGPISILSDSDLNGTGNINLANNVATNANITLNAGFKPGASSSSINQTVGQVSSGTGNILAEAALDITVNGSAASFTSTSGNISMFANNNISTLKTITSTAGGSISLTADADNTGAGNLSVGGTITTTTGAICLAAGPGTFGCSQSNCSAGGISGFPVGNCTVTIGAPVSSTSGSITVTSAENINVNSTVTTAGPIALTAGLGDFNATQPIRSTGSTIFTFAGNNTTLTQSGAAAVIHAAAEIRMITGLNMTLDPNTAILSNLPGGEVTLIVDNIHPAQVAVPFPANVSGSFTMRAGSSVTSGSPLRIFTAYSQIFGAGAGTNSVDPTALLNGVSPAAFGYPGAPFADTATEQWCVFFSCPANYPFPALGVPFTFFYKVCEQQVAIQAGPVITEFLVDLHPYNEFPGWMERFYLQYSMGSKLPDRLAGSSLSELRNEAYYFRRRHLNVINHPKSWTQLFY